MSQFIKSPNTALQDGSVTTAKIADSAVTTAKINDSAVTTAKINDSAVTTAKINDSAVTTAKINDAAVTSAKLASSVQTDISNGLYDNQFQRILVALGSDIKGLSFGCGYPSDNFVQFTDNYIHLTAVWLPFAATLTGVKYYVSQQGAFTEDNENRIGLYTWSSGTLTLVASSADDANIWKAATGFATKAFSSTYAASAGLYFVGGLYNYSAQTTAPRLATNGTILFAAATTLMGMASSSKVAMNQNPHNTLPSSITVSATSNQSQNIWFALY